MVVSRNKVYSILSYLVAAGVVAYIAISQHVISAALYKKGDYSFFTGTPALHSTNPLEIELTGIVSTLELQLPSEISGAIVVPTDGSLRAESIRVERRGSWLVIQATEPATSSLRSLSIEFKKTKKSSDKRFVVIDSVRVNGRHTIVRDFIENYANLENSNVKYYIPLAFENISTELASGYGNRVTSAIQFILLSFLGIQLIQFLAGFIYQPPGLAEYFEQPENGRALVFIDRYCNSYSIPLGFLGTLISIWVALESDTSSFENFDEIVRMFKIAIFTSVLGLSIKMVCTFRASRFNVIELIQERRSGKS